MEELERSLQICRDPLTIQITGGPNEGRGTWVHPDVAIHLAQWCSPKFAVQVSRWVREWMTSGALPAYRMSQTQAETLRHLATARTKKPGLRHASGEGEELATDPLSSEKESKSGQEVAKFSLEGLLISRKFIT